MKTLLYILSAAAILSLMGCRTPEDDYGADSEYSSMPWNTPQSWEGSRSVPGVTPGY